MTPDGPSQDSERGRIGLWQVALCAFAALAVYLLLGQRTWHLEDGFQLVQNHLARGNWAHDVHPLYLPLVGGLGELLDWTGLGTYRLARLASALGAALAVLLTGLLTRSMQLDRRSAWLMIACVAACPALGFFATVVEFHAVFLPFAVLAFLVAESSRLSDPGRPAAWFAAPLLGLVTATATLVHATGHLLVPLLWVWILARAGSRRRVREVPVFALVHGLVFWVATRVLLWLLGLEHGGGASRSMLHITSWFQWEGFPGRLGRSLVQELLLQYLPVSCLLLVALFGRVRWRTAVWVVLGVFPFVLLDAAINAEPGTGRFIFERGAYLLPILVPGAWLFVRSPLPRKGLLIVVAGCLSVALVLDHDERPGKAWAEGLGEVAGERTWLLAGGPTDHRYALLELPELRSVWLGDLLLHPERTRASLALLTERIDALLEDGSTVLLSGQVRIWSLPEPQAGTWKRILDALERRYSLADVESGAFSGQRLGLRR